MLDRSDSFVLVKPCRDAFQKHAVGSLWVVA